MSKARHGIFIGRMQPIHLGHMYVINKMLDDGLTPIIVLGSSQEKRDVNMNPLSFEQRVELVKLAYPNVPKIEFIKSDDFDSDYEWLDDMLASIRDITEEHVTLYYHEKENDMRDVRIGAVHYNTYGQMFDNVVYKMDVKFVEPYVHPAVNEVISATSIRRNFKDNRCLMPREVYKKLKEWKWK